MSTYARTAIRRIAVRGFRSLKDVVVEDIPDIVVLHGPNGGGKSNLLRAAQLVLRAAQLEGPLPMGNVGVRSLSLQEADETLKLRPDDFRIGGLPNIRVELTIDLGYRAFQGYLPDDLASKRICLDLAAMFQHVGDKAVRFWFDQAHVRATSEAGSLDDRGKLVARWFALIRGELPDMEQGHDVLPRATLQRAVFARLLQTSEAYRVPGGADDPQVALYNAFLSEDPRERDAVRRLGRRLATAGLFGAAKDDVGLIPVDSRTYGEKQIRFRHPTHGELPLRNLGSGEQQLVIMLGQRVITPFPIAQIEEPEAHLHRTLMEPLARLLLQSVQGDGGIPDVDQLWIATHHHHFAIAPEFFDVSLDEGGNTQVVRKLRDLAVTHFYEPSPVYRGARAVSAPSLDEVLSFAGPPAST